MTLKAILFDLNGVIINDEAIHQQLVDNLLLEENLISANRDYRKYCLGRGDRGLKDLLVSRGRRVTDDHLKQLILRKAAAYEQYIQQIEALPAYPGLPELLEDIKTRGIYLGLVAGTLRSEACLILERLDLIKYFEIIVGLDEVTEGKPDPESYLLAVKKFNQFMPLSSYECLAIEDTPPGIQAAKSAGMQVVGVANTYPFHFMQRLANWAVDYLQELEWDRIEQVFASFEDVV